MAPKRCQYDPKCAGRPQTRTITDIPENVKRSADVCPRHWCQLSEEERKEWMRDYGRTERILFSGSLSDPQIDRGIKACLRHAVKLKQVISEIRSLDRGVAYSLACIRVEELAKIQMLREMRSRPEDCRDWQGF